MNGATLLVRALRRAGVDHIFGLPGDTGMALYDALYAEPAIQHIMTRDERSAAFMADVYARVSGRIGVCEGPSGGGATYLLPGVAEAHGSAIPMLAMTSDTPISQDHRGVLTELDQPGLYRPVTKSTERVARASSVEDAVARAVRLAVSDRPGAVHLSLPEDVLDESHDGPYRPQHDAVPDRVPSSRPRADAAEVEKAAAAIVQADRPVIVAGGGVLISGASESLTLLAESANIPVGTSINGKGSIAETSPVSLGVVGGNGARSYANVWIRDADLVVFIGTRTESTTTSHWTLPPRENPPRSIHLDVSAKEIGNSYPTAATLHGDADATLRDLLEALGQRDLATLSMRHASRIEMLEAQRTAYFDSLHAMIESDSQPIKPQRLIATVRELLDDNAIIVADPGTPTPYLGAQYLLHRAGRTTVIPRAHGGLGYAIPGVVGAHYAAPDRRAVAITADGSYGMAVGELETISRLNLPVVIIQCANATYGWIKELQHLYHDQRYYSVDFNHVDYARIARGFGLDGYHVQDPAALRSTLQEAFASGRPSFVNVVTEAQMTETPPVSAWEKAVAAQ